MVRSSFELLTNFFCYFLKLSFGQLQFLAAEVNVLFRLHGNKMNVGVGHFEAKHHLCHFSTGESPSNGQGHTLGKELELGKLLVGEVEDVIYFPTRDDEGMALYQRVNVEKSVEVLVFCALV